jgi:hypothetical protein
MQSVWNEYQADKDFRTEEGFRDLIDFARDTPTTKDQTGRIVQDSLPGLETAADRDLTKTKLKLARKVAGNLRTDKNALRGAARNAPTLEGKGNSKIDANASMQAGLETAQLADVFDALKFKSDNDISRLLNEGAAEIAAGAKIDVVARRIQGELAQAAEGVVMPAKAPEPVAPVAPEAPMPKTAKDHEANQMLVLNRAAAQGEVRPSATPIPVPPAPPEIDVAKAAKGIDAQDVMGGDSQLKFAQQQRQAALDTGDTKAVEAWDKEIRKVNQGRLGAAMDAQDASQTGLFGVTEYDNSMPLFDQKLDAEEARLAAEYLERDTAMQQEVARAEREAMGYNDMTFDQKKAEAGVAEGWAPAELPPAPEPAAVKPLPKTMLAAGETAQTASGRETTPFPKFNLNSKGSAARATKAVDRWLLENAAAEARARGDDFNAPVFEADAKQKTISQGSKDAAEEYLFGQQPPVQPPALMDVAPKAVETKALFDELAGQLRELDGGKLKGVSKKALDAAEKGNPELALAEATDYASRRMAEIDNKIEDIKRRAIEEGC